MQFSSHSGPRSVLLKTASSGSNGEPLDLVEAAPHDFFWGRGIDNSGSNHLGVLLGRVREQLLAIQKESLVAPTITSIMPNKDLSSVSNWHFFSSQDSMMSQCKWMSWVFWQQYSYWVFPVFSHLFLSNTVLFMFFIPNLEVLDEFWTIYLLTDWQECKLGMMLLWRQIFWALKPQDETCRDAIRCWKVVKYRIIKEQTKILNWSHAEFVWKIPSDCFKRSIPKVTWLQLH